MSGQQRDPTQEAEFREKLDKLMELSNYVCFQEPGEEPGIYGGEFWTEDYGVYGRNGAHYCRFSGPNGAEGVHLFYPDGSYCYISPRGTKYYEAQNGFSQVTMRDGIKRVVTRAGEAVFTPRTCQHDERSQHESAADSFRF